MILTYLNNSRQAIKALNNAYLYAMKRPDSTRFVTCVEEQQVMGDWHDSQLFSIITETLHPGDELVIYDLTSLGFHEADILEMLMQVALKGLVLHVLKYKMKVSLKDKENLGLMCSLVGVNI